MAGGKGKKLDPEQVEQQQDAYSASNAEDLLETAFGKWDETSSTKSKVPDLDRADHIIIGGRTASEILVERFNKEFASLRDSSGYAYGEDQRKDAYNSYYGEKGKKYVNQMVSEALNRGETVEVFVPDEVTGQIKDEPMKLTHDGYRQLSPLAKPAQLNRWQKFWSKLGFYKQEKAAVQDYEKKMAVRDKVKFCNKVAVAALTTNSALKSSYMAELKKYQPGMLQDMQENFPTAGGDPAAMGLANGFKTTRSSFLTTAMTLLASKKDKDGNPLYTNKELFDLTDAKMQEARANAMKEVYDHYKPGALLKKEIKKKEAEEKKGEKYEIDRKLVEEAAKARDWLVDLQYNTAGELRNRISEQAGKLDFSKPGLTEQKDYREYALLCDTAFDLSQDMYENNKRMDERHGKGAYRKASGEVGDCSQPAREFSTSLICQRNLLNGYQGKNESSIMRELADVFKAQTIQQQISKAMADNPGMKYADAATENTLNAARDLNGIISDPTLLTDHRNNGSELPGFVEQTLSLAKEKIRDPVRFDRQIRNGVLEGRVKLQGVGDFGQDIYDRTITAKFKIRDAKTVEREMLQQKQQEIQKTDDTLVL